ncbi:hypothetical protein GALMADRAFT_145280 [Galerina marginata CBS 339.88]|nr:hypothetical protein GALMADRAFT_145280 [Galerina marginata CBS 339.88]
MDSLAVLYPELFGPSCARHCLAIILTLLDFCVDEWRRGPGCSGIKTRQSRHQEFIEQIDEEDEGFVENLLQNLWRKGTSQKPEGELPTKTSWHADGPPPKRQKKAAASP